MVDGLMALPPIALLPYCLTALLPYCPIALLPHGHVGHAWRDTTHSTVENPRTFSKRRLMKG
jgi:hypothetical protein